MNLTYQYTPGERQRVVRPPVESCPESLRVRSVSRRVVSFNDSIKTWLKI